MVNPSEVNPYQSPGAVDHEPAVANTEDTASTRTYVAWITVFIGNMAIPLLVGWAVTEQGGRWGMLVAVVLLFVLGCWLCAAAPRVSKALLVGGVAVGLSQAIPMLQIMAGIAGLGFAKLLWPDVLAVNNDVSGFVATLVTGGLLMAAALVIGLAIRGLFSKWR